MPKIRIVYAIKSMPVGGSQTHLLQVLRLLDQRRFDPILYCLTGEGALLDAVRAHGVRVIDGGLRKHFNGVPALRAILRMARVLRRERVDLVHNYLLRANAIGSLAARLARVPVTLVSKRGCHERHGVELAGARLGNWLANCVTVNANAVRDFVHENERCPREKMVMIPSGVDTDRFRPLAAGDHKTRLGLDPQRPVVGIVTRMRVRKGVEEFLRAMIKVRERLPAAQAVIVGEVELDDELRAVVAQGGLTAHLHLLGRRTDIPEVLSAFDLFVLSSHDEGMSNAILEAMAMEKPVVATDVGGTGEVVRHGHTGLLVPPKDPVPLAAAIAELLASGDRAVEMGRLGRRVVEERFSAHAMVRQMEDLYVKLLQQRGVVVADEAVSDAVPNIRGEHA
ncbi:MAG: glycosyltransferase [Deltaproteobacteria bacterium]|nr:glycosyltransferase [Deltaproteobacteria bacterium]MBI3389754.1 glycosyltransferase [Deltaproteobacteria bacterium]